MRARLLKVFERGAARPLPWAAHLTYWHAAQSTSGTLDPRYAGQEGHCIRHLFEDCGRFIVGSADQVPPNGDIGRVRRIAARLGLV